MASKKSRDKSKKKKILWILVLIAVLAVSAVFLKYKYAPAEKMAAKVNGEVILKEEVLREYLKVPPEQRTIITADNILEGMIAETLLLQEAKKSGIAVSDEEADAYLKNIMLSYGISEENLTAALEENDITLEELKASFKERMAISRLLNQTAFRNITVSEPEMEDYYAGNIAEFTIPEQVRASHILVNTSDEARLIRGMALEGVSFEQLAEEHSLDKTTARKGGDLGWFSRGQTIKEFEDVAFSLKAGEVSQPVQTKYGFHIIKLAERSAESKLTYDEVKDQVRQKIIAGKQAAAIEAFIDELKAKSKIEIFMSSREEPEGTPITEIIKAQNKAEEDGAETVQQTAAQQQTNLSLAKCLASKGAKMYGSESSEMSKEQKAIFGSDFESIDYVDCGAEKEACAGAGITSYPTWVINGKKYIGAHSLEALAEAAGCS